MLLEKLLAFGARTRLYFCSTKTDQLQVKILADGDVLRQTNFRSRLSIAPYKTAFSKFENLHRVGVSHSALLEGGVQVLAHRQVELGLGTIEEVLHLQLARVLVVLLLLLLAVLLRGDLLLLLWLR